MHFPPASTPQLLSKYPFAASIMLHAMVVAICGILGAGSSWLSAAIPTDEQVRWEEIANLQHALALDPPAGQNNVEYEAPIEAKLHEATGAFAKDFPASNHHWEAAILELKTVYFPAPADERRVIFQEQERKVAAILSAPGAPDSVHADAERTVVRQHLDHLDLISTPAEALALEARISALIAKNPSDPKIYALQLRRVDLFAKADPARATELLNSLASDPDPKVASSAQGRLAQQALSTAPLDWSVTDAAGASFRADQYRGKVVLVDFWASWCPDCLREMPKVIEAYQRYHAQGLEVVGVSLDKNKDALTAFTKKHAMPWPQYFDGKGWDNELAVKYGVRGIPEMWLVDTSGHVVATGLHGDDLDHRIAGLLNL